MHYEINVALNGQHFFATDERSISTETKCKRLYDLFKISFPESEGYEVTASVWQKTGKAVKFGGDDTHTVQSMQYCPD